jgi:hypothetical protein
MTFSTDITARGRDISILTEEAAVHGVLPARSPFFGLTLRIGGRYFYPPEFRQIPYCFRRAPGYYSASFEIDQE